MHHDDTMKWVLGGVVLYFAWQWYQSYSSASVAPPETIAPVVSPNFVEGPIVLPGPPMSATIY